MIPERVLLTVNAGTMAQAVEKVLERLDPDGIWRERLPEDAKVEAIETLEDQGTTSWGGPDGDQSKWAAVVRIGPR